MTAFKTLSMIGAKKILILAPVVLTLFSCKVESIRHEPTKAVSDTNQFLRALYFEEDYARALVLADAQLRQSLSAEDLRQLVEGIRQQRGKLEALKADSYLMVQGRGMELFYVGTYEKGVLYHRLVLMGDATSGYRVSGLWYSTDPYPEQALRRKLDQDINVQ